MKSPRSIAVFSLVLGLLASSTAFAEAGPAGSAEAQLMVSAVVLSRCQFSDVARVTVDCRRGVAWTVAITTVVADDLVAAPTGSADRVLVKQVYF